MTYTVKFMPMAKRDFLDIAEYIARDNSERALSFIQELEIRTLKTLSVFPSGNSLYRSNIRYFPIENYVVLYEIGESNKVVNVLRIVNATTNWKKLIK